MVEVAQDFWTHAPGTLSSQPRVAMGNGGEATPKGLSVGTLMAQELCLQNQCLYQLLRLGKALSLNLPRVASLFTVLPLSQQQAREHTGQNFSWRNGRREKKLCSRSRVIGYRFHDDIMMLPISSGFVYFGASHWLSVCWAASGFIVVGANMYTWNAGDVGRREQKFR